MDDGWIICGQSAGYDSIVQCALFYYVKGVVTQSVWTWYYFAEPQNIKRLLLKSKTTECSATDTMLGQ